MQPTLDLEIARPLPPPGCTLDQAQRYTHWLTTHHYENFTVVSWLLPRRLRQHFYNVYSYCRWADDLGDEVPDRARALELLNWWESELRKCYAGAPSHPVFIALEPTVRRFDIPITPFLNLLTAFRQDQAIERYADWDGVLGYCRNSANPVGHLVLYLCGYRDAVRQRLSNFTCTALQLANFWQDVRRDLEKGRIYIPLDRMAAHGLTEADLAAHKFDERYVALMKELIARTRELFDQGRPLLDMVSPELRTDIDLFSRGGRAVLDSIERTGYDTLHTRPALGRAAKIRLLGRALVERSLAPKPEVRSQTPGVRSQMSGVRTPDVEVSYEHCRELTRRAARNFYYGIFRLPREKRDAVCALYAFMRRADDISDEPGTVTEKRRRLNEWRAALDQTLEGRPAADPAMPAFYDAVRRYSIPSRYLHDLVSGVEMDLSVTSYPTFERLREYCYRVAGTVGLTCIHIFGFDDPRAVDLAERLGIAFQLTNILRDLREDLSLGRVYVPVEDLDRFGVSAGDLAAGKMTSAAMTPAQLSPAMTALLRHQAERAWRFYDEGVELVGMISADSRPALWALVRIYSGILRRIEQRGYDVFTPPRVGLSAAEKTWIMSRAWMGWWQESDVLR